MARDTLLVDIDSAGELQADIVVATKALSDSPPAEYLRDLERQLGGALARIAAEMAKRDKTLFSTRKYIAEIKESTRYKWAYDRLAAVLPLELLEKFCPRSVSTAKLLEHISKADAKTAVNLSQCYEKSVAAKLEVYPATK